MILAFSFKNIINIQLDIHYFFKEKLWALYQKKLKKKVSMVKN